ncbi:hypothetical protein RRG08_021991 [Elysia crispata]|uniref:Uncharacterized protein n=1 Tax=Elysia crispata TaxID=231223 RepID=A0AAE0XSR7_9GAST|nr:hypothetical protein RRG08_021991 [Elysia crispata]
MPRNGNSGMYSIKKNCFGDSSVGQRTSHEVIEPLEIGDQPEKKMFTLLYLVVMAGNILIQLGGMNADPCTTLCICKNNIQFNTTSGTWSFKNVRPSTRASWTNKVKPICE